MSLALMAALAACGGEDGSESGGDDTYDIVGVLSLSGPLAATGESVKVAATAAVDVINANGGIDDKKVTITFMNDKGEPPENAAIVQSLVNSDDPPDALLPGITTATASAGLSAVGNHKILSLGSPASPTLSDFPLYIGGSASSPDVQGALMAKVAESGAKTFGLLVSDDEIGQSLIDLWKDKSPEHGLELVGTGKVPVNAVEVVSTLEQLRSSEPDVLVASIYGPGVPVIIKSRAKLGWDVPLWGDSSFSGTDFYDGLDPAAFEGVTMVAPQTSVVGSDLSKTEAYETMREALSKAQGGPLQGTAGAYVPNYMALIILHYAAEAAGSTDADAIYEARSKLDPKDMPLYAGSSTLWKTQDSHWPTFLPEDFTGIKPGSLEEGFLLPGE